MFLTNILSVLGIVSLSFQKLIIYIADENIKFLIIDKNNQLIDSLCSDSGDITQECKKFILQYKKNSRISFILDTKNTQISYETFTNFKYIDQFIISQYGKNNIVGYSSYKKDENNINVNINFTEVSKEFEKIVSYVVEQKGYIQGIYFFSLNIFNIIVSTRIINYKDTDITIFIYTGKKIRSFWFYQREGIRTADYPHTESVEHIHGIIEQEAKDAGIFSHKYSCELNIKIIVITSQEIKQLLSSAIKSTNVMLLTTLELGLNDNIDLDYGIVLSSMVEPKYEAYYNLLRKYNRLRFINTLFINSFIVLFIIVLLLALFLQYDIYSSKNTLKIINEYYLNMNNTLNNYKKKYSSIANFNNFINFVIKDQLLNEALSQDPFKLIREVIKILNINSSITSVKWTLESSDIDSKKNPILEMEINYQFDQMPKIDAINLVSLDIKGLKSYCTDNKYKLVTQQSNPILLINTKKVIVKLKIQIIL